MKLLKSAVVAILLAAPLATFASAKAIVITVNKVSQKMTVAVDGQTEYVWPVSTGGASYTTPSGTYRPFRMEKEHFSEEWDNAPMPNSIFFTGAGHAIHGSYHVKSLGRAVSHGCVRLSPANAATLYALVTKNGLASTRVVVRGGFFDSAFNDSFDSPPKFKLPKITKPAFFSHKKGGKKRFFIFGGLDG
jgi:L,D-transpeptidase catalytic domain